MMAPRFKKKHLFLIASAGAIAVGILAFVLAYGISKGWDALGHWFGSSSAIFLYMILGFYLILVAYILISDKVKKL